MAEFNDSKMALESFINGFEMVMKEFLVDFVVRKQRQWKY